MASFGKILPVKTLKNVQNRKNKYQKRAFCDRVVTSVCYAEYIKETNKTEGVKNVKFWNHLSIMTNKAKKQAISAQKTPIAEQST